MEKNEYELLIVGGGPIGLACGLEARKAKLQYIILEKGTLTNSLFNYPLNMSFFSTSERLEIGGVPFVSNQPKPNRPEALEAAFGRACVEVQPQAIARRVGGRPRRRRWRDRCLRARPVFPWRKTSHAVVGFSVNAYPPRRHTAARQRRRRDALPRGVAIIHCLCAPRPNQD